MNILTEMLTEMIHVRYYIHMLDSESTYPVHSRPASSSAPFRQAFGLCSARVLALRVSGVRGKWLCRFFICFCIRIWCEILGNPRRSACVDTLPAFGFEPKSGSPVLCTGRIHCLSTPCRKIWRVFDK